MTGFLSSTPAMVTFVFITVPPPYLKIPVHLCRLSYCAHGNVRPPLLTGRHRQDRLRYRKPCALPSVSYTHLNKKKIRFTDKKHSRQGIISSGLGGAALMLFAASVDVYKRQSLERVLQLAKETYGTWYIRLRRRQAPIIYGTGAKFEVGKSCMLKDGTDVTIIAMGYMVDKALELSLIHILRMFLRLQYLGFYERMERNTQVKR